MREGAMAGGAPSGSRRRHVWAFVVAVDVAAIAIGAAVLPQLDRPPSPHRLHWVVLAALFYLAEANVVHLHFRRQTHSFSLSELALVLGLFFADPLAIVAAQAVGAGAALVVHRGQRPAKLLFNLGQFALATTVGAVVFHALLRTADLPGPPTWVAAFVGVLVASAVGTLATQAVITIAEAGVPAKATAEVAGMGIVAAVANASLGVMTVTVMWDEPVGYWLLFVPGVTLYAAYRAVVSERQKREGIQALYDATRLLHGTRDADMAVSALLDHARDMFRAEIAELTLFPGGDGSRALRAFHGPDGLVERMQPVELDPAELVLASLAADRGGVLVHRRGQRPALGGWLSCDDYRNAMAAALLGDREPVGVLRVANRLDDVSSFDAGDLRLLETLASHVGMALENGHLEESLLRLRAREADLEHQAYSDPLTGLANRVLFGRRLDEALARDADGTAVVFVDLDEFKSVNDTLGHDAGDQVLRIVADRIRGCLRPGDTPARLGGDEFAVLLRRTGGPENARRVAERLLDALSRPVALDHGPHVTVPASLGLALGGADRSSATALLRHADRAMYAAKARGKGMLEVVVPEPAGPDVAA
jgi:diguanylate cyclase (GGDEF)-like protein